VLFFLKGGGHGRTGSDEKQKTPQDGGVESLYLLRLSRIVPVTGLALAPRRLDQVAGRSQGQYPHTTLDALFI